MAEDKEFKDAIRARFMQLPKVVQDAITSADVEKRLRDLANTHKLHLDQWETLENQVMLTLLGIEHSDDLQKNIQSEVGVDDETAKLLTEDISRAVFEPIRQELERQLEHPEAKAAEISGVEAMRTQVLSNQPKADSATSYQLPATSPVAPATPPAPPPEGKATRAPISEAYKAGEPSSARKAIEDDPYREPPV